MPGITLDLTGQIALVTGASGHIGSAIARRFAEAGAAVIVHYHRNEADAKAVAEEITADPHCGKAQAICADLTNEHEVQALIDETTSWGRLDSVVNNAAIQPLQELSEMSVSEWSTVLKATLTSPFAVTQAAALAMRETGGGTITHIASIEALQPAHAHAHYCSAKAGLVMHAANAAREYKHWGIRVNAVSPGLIDRPGLSGQWPEGVERYTAAATRLGTGTDVANACIFLASEQGAWFNGANLVLDGGASANSTW